MIDIATVAIKTASFLIPVISRLTSHKNNLLVIGNFCDTYESASHVQIKFASTKLIHIKSIRILKHLVSSDFHGDYVATINTSRLIDPKKHSVIDLFVQPPLVGNQSIVLLVATNHVFPFPFSLSPLDFGEHRSHSWPAPITDEYGAVLVEPLDIIEEFESLNTPLPPSELRP